MSDATKVAGEHKLASESSFFAARCANRDCLPLFILTACAGSWHCPLVMILTQPELESLIKALHRHPHQLLGMHPLGDGSGVVVRAYLHNAAQVEVVPVSEKSRPRIKLERVHE